MSKLEISRDCAISLWTQLQLPDVNVSASTKKFLFEAMESGPISIPAELESDLFSLLVGFTITEGQDIRKSEERCEQDLLSIFTHHIQEVIDKYPNQQEYVFQWRDKRMPSMLSSEKGLQYMKQLERVPSQHVWGYARKVSRSLPSYTTEIDMKISLVLHVGTTKNYTTLRIACDTKHGDEWTTGENIDLDDVDSLILVKIFHALSGGSEDWHDDLQYSGWNEIIDVGFEKKISQDDIYNAEAEGLDEKSRKKLDGMRTVYDNAADEDAQQRVITDIHKHASIKKFLHRQMLRWDKKILDTIMDNIGIQCAVLIQDVRDRRLCDRIRCKDNTLTRNKIRAASKSAFGTEIAPDYYTECHDDANVSIKIMKQGSDTYSVVLFFDVDDESIPAEYISDEVTASRLLSFIKRVSYVSGRPLADCLCARR